MKYEFLSIDVHDDSEEGIALKDVNAVITKQLEKGWQLVSVVAWPESDAYNETVWVFFQRPINHEHMHVKRIWPPVGES